MPQSDRPGPPEPAEAVDEPTRPRALFLDDDPARAEVFLAGSPHAVWVQTAADCIARLSEPWAEVHLDHDLGGEHFVDTSRDDCGMEVVRWICARPRPHLRPTKFFVHSHNVNAAMVMAMQMMVNGFSVEVRPFGASADPEEVTVVAVSVEPPPPRAGFRAAVGAWLRRRFGRDEPDPAFDYPLERPGPDEPRPPRPDFDWTPPSVRKKAAPASTPKPADPPAPGAGAG